MKIMFRFQVRQTDKNTVEVVEQVEGRPLLDINYHTCLKVSDETAEKVYQTALTEVIRATVDVVL